MTAINAFFAMGGYAGFVWPAFAAAGVTLAVLWVASHRRLRAIRKAVGDLEPDRRGRSGP